MAVKFLYVPEEPVELKSETRTLVENKPEQGRRLVREAAFIAEPLWEIWGEELEARGMDYERFLEIVRGYAGEIWLWVMGERIWEHWAGGLAGRVARRVPNGSTERVADAVEVCGQR